MAVGVLGGAFAPPHVGHVALARAAIEHFGLTRLLVRVVADPGHRSVVAPAGARLELATIAFAPLREAEVALDLHQRTVDSLDELRLLDPVFLIGADELAAFPGWKQPNRVLELARLGVATRPGADEQRIAEALAAISRPERVERFTIEPHSVSSSEIRERVANEQSIDGLASPDVVRAIAKLGLYARPAAATLRASERPGQTRS
jgi:nicotinate-nucleotide adenylyltransferase